MTIRTKYIATSDFSVAGAHFTTGDEVTDPIALDAVLRFGERFVMSDTRRARKAAAADTDKVEAQPPTNQIPTEVTQ